MWIQDYSSTNGGEVMPKRTTQREDGIPVRPGKSILETLWDELDAIVDRLQADGPPNRELWMKRSTPEHIADEFQEYGEERGRAQGVAHAIAILTNPYAPNVDAIREEAMRRWEQGQG